MKGVEFAKERGRKKKTCRVVFLMGDVSDRLRRNRKRKKRCVE